MLKTVAIPWDVLVQAFSNMEQDRAYFFDRMTGEIFCVGTEADEAFWHLMERDHERYLEIPVFDAAAERALIARFLEKQDNSELRGLLEHALSGLRPYARPADILSFFPEEERQLDELRDSFMSNRVKTWLEEHNLYSFSTSLTAVQ